MPGRLPRLKCSANALGRAGEAPLASKEPTSGPWGKLIKNSATTGRLPLPKELEAFIQDRTEHVSTLVNPALEDGRIVILDRYFYSSIAYQGSRGANYKEVEAIMEAKFPIPDAVFILDIDPALGVHRIAHSRGEEPNHFEDRKNLAKAREIFNELSGPTIHHLDGSNSREIVHAQILERLIDGALKAKRCAKDYGCDDPFHCTFRITETCEWVKLSRALRSAEPVIA